MTARIVLVAACVLYTQPALGQSFDRERWLYYSIAAADVASTLACSPCVELNPAVGWLQPKVGKRVMLAIGEAADVALVELAIRKWGRERPLLVKAGLYAVMAVRVWAVAHNLREGGRARENRQLAAQPARAAMSFSFNPW